MHRVFSFCVIGIFLQQLDHRLVDDPMNRHYENPWAFQQGVWLAMKTVGLSMTHPTTTASKTGGRRSCHLCPTSHEKTIATQSSTCAFPYSLSHYKIICHASMESVNEDKKKRRSKE